jgi:hypothetical protein
MRVATTEAFNQFLLSNTHRYPFNSNLHITRSSFFCKWIMVKGKSSAGLQVYFPNLANSYSNPVLLHMIHSGEAKPLPLELSQIMDGMWWWGASSSHHWYEQVVTVVSQALDNGLGLNKKDFVRHCLSFHIFEMIQASYHEDSIAFDLVFIEWIHWFNNNYKVQDFDNDFCFRLVAITSFNSAEHILNEVKP